MRLLTRELLAQLEQVHIPSRRRLRYHHRGERASMRKGSSLEFSDYREYLPGDDIRSIDWNVYARTDRLFLKLFLEDESKPVYFVLDASESMNFGEPTKYEYCKAFAAALSYVSLINYDKPRILLVQNNSFRAITISSLPQFFPVVQQMEQLETGGPTQWSAALKKIALSAFPKGIYFLMSDFYSLDGWDGMKLLAAAGNELHCLQVLTEEEMEPTLRGDLRLLDSETNADSEVSITPSVLKRYKTRLSQMQETLKQTAFRSFASFYIIRTSTPLSLLVLQNLRKTGVLA
ncbi:DUF58 domain-containing protein [bacterium]|nr:DUF58 domain-containing protein [bacterium]MCI0606143.1 DUF58 domain-containing protein [bacterium]